MKYAPNQQGIEALRKMAESLNSVGGRFEADIRKTISAAEAGEKTLGPHQASLVEALEQIRIALNNVKSELDTIQGILIEVAEGYQDVVEAELMAGIPGLTAEEAKAISRNPENRTPHQAEVADLARHPEYAGQKSFATDPKTGSVIYDESGNPVEAAYGSRGSQRPDGYRVDENGRVDLRENKSYHNVYSLMNNMAKQTAKRRRGFGDQVRITFVLSRNDFTLAEADMIWEKAEELGVDIEWQMK